MAQLGRRRRPARRAGRTGRHSRARLTLALLLLGVGVGVGPLAGASGGTGASGAGGSWTVVGSSPEPLDHFDWIDCATDSVCEAIGQTAGDSSANDDSVVYGSVDGGASWTRQLVVDNGWYSQLDSISCPSASVCELVGGVTTSAKEHYAYRTVDGGASWTPQDVPSAIPLSAVSCPTVSTCFAIGVSSQRGPAVAFATSDGGASWRPLPLAAQLKAASAFRVDISCASTRSCAVDAGTDANTGRLWTTSDAGASWTLRLTARRSYLGALSCSEPDRCLLAESVLLAHNRSKGVLLRTSDAGLTWSSFALPAAASAGLLRCFTLSDCVLGTAAALLETTDGGKRWTVEKLPSQSGTFGIILASAMDCADPAHCVAAVVGDTGSNSGTGLFYTTSDGGARWTTSPWVFGLDTLRVSCGIGGACVATGDSWALVRAAGATTWSAPLALPMTLGGLSCVTASFCEAFSEDDDDGVGDLDPAAPSTAQRFVIQAVPASFGVGAVSCASVADCVATGSAYRTPGEETGSTMYTTDGGTSWFLGRGLPSGDPGLVGISCPTVEVCQVVGSTDGENPGAGGLALRSDDGGAQWTTEKLPRYTSALGSVSCSSPADCVAVGPGSGEGSGEGGSSVVVTVNGGTTWSEAAVGATDASELDQVSCSGGTCEVVSAEPPGAGVWGTSDDGTSWTNPEQLPPGVSLSSVSCYAPGSCVGAGTDSITDSVDLLSLG